MRYTDLVMASAAFNVLSDAIILLLPVRAIWELRIGVKKLIVINLHFTTGLL